MKTFNLFDIDSLSFEADNEADQSVSNADESDVQSEDGLHGAQITMFDAPDADSADKISDISEISLEEVDLKEIDLEEADIEEIDLEAAGIDEAVADEAGIDDKAELEEADREELTYTESDKTDICENTDEDTDTVAAEGIAEDGISASNEDSYTIPSVLKDDCDTDRLAEWLEDDVTSEVPNYSVSDQADGDSEADMEFSENITADISINESLPNFKDIKSMTLMDRFECPYTYSGKNGDRVRYRLSLPNDRKPGRRRIVKSTVSFIITIIVAFIIALLLRSFVFVFATVDGPSMQPTLYTNERLFVTRYTYYFNEIERGDIVVCKFPSPAYPDKYVKRVIALGGETVAIQDGTVYINGSPLREDYIKSPALADMEEQYVPEGCVFVMGDNRNNSSDSRKPTIGAIPKDLIMGKARCILFPFSKMGSLEEKN